MAVLRLSSTYSVRTPHSVFGVAGSVRRTPDVFCRLRGAYHNCTGVIA